jgi:hypothetical protein
LLLDVVVDDVVELDDDGAAVELVVAVDVVVAGVVLVSVDVLAVVDAVVELDDVVVEPQAVSAARAPAAAAKLKIKRMLSSSRIWDGERFRRSICQPPWRNLTTLKAAVRRRTPRLGRLLTQFVALGV